jgi:hypothetical protein
MKDAVLQDPYGTTHALRFSVNYTFKDSVSVLELKLGSLFRREVVCSGCWENRGGTADSYCSYIRWRFCGGFRGR